MLHNAESLSQCVVDHVRRDFVSVRPDWTITQCLESLRGEQDTGGIYYIYVTDNSGILVGVIPVRRMLAVNPSTSVNDIMIGKLMTLPDTASVYDACQMFMNRKFLAIPIVDKANCLIGIVDVNVFTDEMIDMSERNTADDVFQWIGVRMDVLGNASSLTAFRYRFPWLMATMASGVACAGLAGLFAQTLAHAAILAMFLTVALGLGESVSIQSMTMTMQALHGVGSVKDFIRKRLKQEIQTALLLAVSCGIVIGGVSIFWPGALALSIAIGVSIAMTIILAGLTGLAVPTLLHKLQHDPKVAAGPITLAIADLSTVFLYLLAGAIAIKLAG